MCTCVCILGWGITALIQGSELNKNLEQIFFLVKREILILGNVPFIVEVVTVEHFIRYKTRDYSIFL